jgi:hypothetical protein
MPRLLPHRPSPKVSARTLYWRHLVLVGAHDEDAAGCVVGDLVRHAAQKESRRAAHALAADDHEVGVLLLGDGDQRLGGVTAARVRDGLQSVSGRGSRRCRQHRLGIGGCLDAPYALTT